MWDACCARVETCFGGTLRFMGCSAWVHGKHAGTLVEIGEPWACGAGGKIFPVIYLFFFLKCSAQVCDCSWGALGLGGGGDLWGVSVQSTLWGARRGSCVVGALCPERRVDRGCHHKGHPARGQRCHKGAWGLGEAVDVVPQ